MLKVILVLVAVITCVAAIPAEERKSPENGVPSTDLRTDATFWWGYRPASYRTYYARPRTYGYYAPYYNSYWRSGWSGYNYYW